MRRFSTLGAGLVAWEPTDNSFFIQRLDARGSPLTADVQLISMGGDPAAVVSLRGFQLAADAQSLWVSAIRQDRVVQPGGLTGFRDGVVVRGFDVTGRPITDPILLAQEEAAGFMRTLPRLAVSNGSVVVSWGQTVAGVPQLLTARVDASGRVQRGQPITDGIGADPLLELDGSTGGVSMWWSSGISWLDENLAAAGLDGIGRATALTSLAGTVDPGGGNSFELTGQSLLRWGFAVDSSVVPPAEAGNWQALKLHLFSRGKPAMERRALVSPENAGPSVQLVFLDDRALMLRQVSTPDGQRWAARVIWF
jgi:hypothetical protein